MADGLPWEAVHGDAADTVRARWREVDAFVLFLAVGAATRIVAPLLNDKRRDAAVVCVDDAGRFAVAVTGGHERGGNLLAHRVGAALGAEPVVTTASDACGTGLVAGIGTSSDAPLDAVLDLLVEATEGRVPDEVATIDRRAAALRHLGLPVRAFTAAELATVDVPNPSAEVRRSVATPSVAEAAALLAAGPGAEVVVPKRKNAVATVAIARRRAGHLSVVGLGPGEVRHSTPAAATAVRRADVVIGYGPYVEQARPHMRPRQEAVRSRAKQAIAEAEAGRRVALVCSGDPGVFAMASLVFELGPAVEVEVVPGVTAALAAASLLGAPLGHDHAVISLSDHLTPWDLIEQRVRAAAEADVVVAFYNPRSSRRTWQLEAAVDILRGHRPLTTPVGIVTDAARPDESSVLTTLGDFSGDAVTMTTVVIVGSSATTVVDGRMVTPRGYLS